MSGLLGQTCLSINAYRPLFEQCRSALSSIWEQVLSLIIHMSSVSHTDAFISVLEARNILCDFYLGRFNEMRI